MADGLPDAATGPQGTEGRDGKGQCVHPVLGGTGAFSGVKGVVHMADRPTASGVRSTYTGTLRYGAPTAASTRSVTTRDLAGRAAARGCGGCVTSTDGVGAPACGALTPPGARLGSVSAHGAGWATGGVWSGRDR